MIVTKSSVATSPNPKLQPLRRARGQGNTSWIGAALKGDDPTGVLLFFGGTGLTDFRLRVAQSHVRQDMLPSFWSHVAIVRRASGRGDWDLYEVSLEPRPGFRAVPGNNGVQEGKASPYDDPDRFPNIACVKIPIASGQRGKRSPAAALDGSVRAFKRQRNLADVPSLILEWLGFVWGAGTRGNPLLRNLGIPSAVLVESVFAIAGIELTPGLESQSSCPEAIWQAAKWWHEFYESGASGQSGTVAGRYFIGQPAAAALE